MIRRHALAASLTLAATTAAACGGGTSPSDRIAEAVSAWYRDVAAGNGKAVCARLTERARKGLVEDSALAGSCEAAVAEFSLLLTDEERRSLGRVEVGRVRVNGNAAQVHDQDLSAPEPWVRDDNDRPLRFRRIDGEWLIEDLG